MLKIIELSIEFVHAVLEKRKISKSSAELKDELRDNLDDRT